MGLPKRICLGMISSDVVDDDDGDDDDDDVVVDIFKVVLLSLVLAPVADEIGPELLMVKAVAANGDRNVDKMKAVEMNDKKIFIT